VNIFCLDLEELTRGVDAHPWVARCRVRRILPDRLRVEVEEEKPAGLARHGEELLLINGQGEVIERGPRESRWAERFPVIGGFRADEPWEACRERARAALGLASLFGGGPGADGGRTPAAEWIDASDPANLAVHFPGRAYPVYVGNEDFSERLARLRFLESIIRERQEEDLQYVDLRFRDRVIVMPSAEESMEEEADGQNG
jgi:cell division septal protein FtsQ